MPCHPTPGALLLYPQDWYGSWSLYRLQPAPRTDYHSAWILFWIASSSKVAHPSEVVISRDVLDTMLAVGRCQPLNQHFALHTHV